MSEAGAPPPAQAFEGTRVKPWAKIAIWGAVGVGIAVLAVLTTGNIPFLHRSQPQPEAAKVSMTGPISPLVRPAQPVVAAAPLPKVATPPLPAAIAAGNDHAKARELDFDNRLLARANRRRLDFEAQRDSWLAVDIKNSKKDSAGDLRYDLLTQHRQPGHWRVLVMATGDMPADRIAQGLRGREIGKALGQIERAGLCRELRHLRENSDADIRQLAGNHRGSLLCPGTDDGAGEPEDSPSGAHKKRVPEAPFVQPRSCGSVACPR